MSSCGLFIENNYFLENTATKNVENENNCFSKISHTNIDLCTHKMHKFL